MSGAAFFDLDRTLVSRSSALALARPFRERGLITRRQLARAALFQVLFSLRGDAGGGALRSAEGGLQVLAGTRPEEMRELVVGALERSLRPLVYAEPLGLLERHRQRGERVYIVSATLQEIVDAIATDLGFDGGVGSLCELDESGAYTGRPLRILHGQEKAEALRELAAAEGFDLEGSTAYSDSHTDLPFLEAVGKPMVVNPDRRLRAIAQRRGWPILEFRSFAYRRAS